MPDDTSMGRVLPTVSACYICGTSLALLDQERDSIPWIIVWEGVFQATASTSEGTTLVSGNSYMLCSHECLHMFSEDKVIEMSSS